MPALLLHPGSLVLNRVSVFCVCICACAPLSICVVAYIYVCMWVCVGSFNKLLSVWTTKVAQFTPLISEKIDISRVLPLETTLGKLNCLQLKPKKH